MAEKTEEGEGGERRRRTSYLGEESTFRLYLDELSDRVVAVAGPLRTVAGVVYRVLKKPRRTTSNGSQRNYLRNQIRNGPFVVTS